MLAQKWNLDEKCMEKEIPLQFHLFKKIHMNKYYINKYNKIYFFKWK